MSSRSEARILFGAAIAALVGLIGVFRFADATEATAALWLVHGVALTLFLAVRRPDLTGSTVRLGLVVAIVIPTVLTAYSVLASADGHTTGHDGGVVVTRASARMVLHGENPYAADFTDSLPPDWRMISMDGTAESAITNPIRTVFPYLPGAFLAIVPSAALGADDGVIGDPRWVMLLTYAAAMIALATWPSTERWTRIAALAAVSGPLMVTHLATGTNDAWVVALMILAARCVPTRPVVAGLLAALAASAKFLLFPALVVWAAWTWHHRGWQELRRYWSAPAALALTTLPFLAWSPADLLNDTVLFWIGASDEVFPVSGFGLPAVLPEMFHGPTLLITTVVCAAGATLAAWQLLSRFPGRAAICPASAIVVLGILVPARTFQGNYLVIVLGLLATAPLLVARPSEAPLLVQPSEAKGVRFETGGNRDGRGPGG